MTKLLACICSLMICSQAIAQTSVSKKDIAGIKAEMEHHLKDAESAKFKDSVAKKTKTGSTIICGLVNSKNAYGGYAGYTPYMAMKFSAGSYMVIGVGESAGKVCIDEMSK